LYDCADEWDEIEEAMGSIGLWMEGNTLSNEKELIAKQLKNAVQNILKQPNGLLSVVGSPQVDGVTELRTPIGFVRIRILAAFGLQVDGRFGTTFEPFVNLKLSGPKGVVYKTSTSVGLDPIWGQVRIAH